MKTCRTIRHTLATLGLLLAAVSLASSQDKPAATPDNGTWTLRFIDFFGSGKPLNLYPSRRDGQWIAAVGTSKLPKGNHYGWNVAKYIADMSGVQVQGNSFKGKIKMILGPDPWVPADHKLRHAEIEVEGKFIAGKEIQGTYKAKGEAGVRDKDRPSEFSGNLSGSIEETKTPDPDNVTYGLVFQDVIPGGKPADIQRRLWVGLGIKNGKVVSAQSGLVNLKHAAYDQQFCDTPEAVEATKDGVKGKMTVPAVSLDGEPVQITIEFKGGRVQGFLAGTYTALTKSVSGKEEKREGTFDGTINPGAAESKFAKDDRPWFVPVKGWKPLEPGEHPRLFFRKSDLSELRRRAETPEGKYIVARLKKLLGGGEEMPKSLNPATKAYDKNSFKAVEGSYSISHAAGFGFLYQLTGDKKYAELARQCVEIAWKGQRNFDDRYAWKAPGGELRAGPSLGWYAVAYDLCYEAWPDDFRIKFAQAIQNYNDKDGGEWGNPEGISLRKMALAPKLGPNSNHYGSVQGGCGLAVLAIKGDPGTDKELLDKYDAGLQLGIQRNLTGGFGDGGFFHEGHGPGGISSDTAFIPYLQALRVVEGRDYTNSVRPNVRNVTMARVWELLGPPAVYPYRSVMNNTYGSLNFAAGRGGLSRGGQFCQGFATVPDAEKPALLWCYRTFVETAKDHTFDTVSPYPHRPMLALINWPFGMEPKNPGEVLSKVLHDSIYEYWVFRNRWQDKDDIVVTALLNAPKGTKPAGVMIWGLGTRNELHTTLQGAVRESVVGQDRSGIISTGSAALAVDFSKASGADALIVLANAGGGRDSGNDGKVRFTDVKAGPTAFQVLTLSSTGQHPEVRVEGDGLVIGKQSVKFTGKTIALGTFTPEKR
jgi:hypothetical protein